MGATISPPNRDSVTAANTTTSGRWSLVAWAYAGTRNGAGTPTIASRVSISAAVCADSPASA